MENLRVKMRFFCHLHCTALKEKNLRCWFSDKEANIYGWSASPWPSGSGGDGIPLYHLLQYPPPKLDSNTANVLSPRKLYFANPPHGHRHNPWKPPSPAFIHPGGPVAPAKWPASEPRILKQRGPACWPCFREAP